MMALQRMEKWPARVWSLRELEGRKGIFKKSSRSKHTGWVVESLDPSL